MIPPTVSVVVPCYNGAGLIGETLDSLARQSFTDFEVLVVDDGSSDGSCALIEAWPDRRVRLIRMDANGGPVVARNRGVAEARGRYIAGLDQDDLCRPERFARQVAFLDAHPAVALVGTQSERLGGGRVLPMDYPARTTPALLAWLTWIENPLAWSSVMLRAEAARALDPFTRPTMRYAEDFDLYHRIGTIARIDEPLLVYRQHAGGVSKRFADTMRANAARVLTERHAALLGTEACAVAALLAVHVMGREPVPDVATLRRLGEVIDRLQAAFVAEHRPDAASLSLIRHETERRRRAILRTALRAGTVTLAEAIGARRTPAKREWGDMAWQAAIGGVRRAARRYTFAE